MNPFQSISQAASVVLLFLALVPLQGIADEEKTSEEKARYRSSSFGLLIGANLSTHTEVWRRTPEYKSGLMGGIHFDIRLSDHFFLHPELRYIQKGVKYIGFYGNEINVRGNYLELPLLLKFFPFKRTGINPYILGGGSIAYLLSQSYYYEDWVLNPSLHNKLDATFQTGLGAEINLSSSTNIFGEIRYSQGFADIKQGSEYRKSRTLEVLTGINFGFSSSPDSDVVKKKRKKRTRKKRRVRQRR